MVAFFFFWKEVILKNMGWKTYTVLRAKNIFHDWVGLYFVCFFKTRLDTIFMDLATLSVVFRS